MKARLRGFGRKQVRGARAVALPGLLALAMMTFGFTQLPSANTLWYETLTLTANVGAGQWATCTALKVTGSAPVVANGQTTYGYTLTGGGALCKNVSYVAIPVCFSPGLAPSGLVINETHPGLGNSVWTYAPQDGRGPFGKRVKWGSVSAGSGPFSGTFTFTVPGTNIATTIVQAETHPDVAAAPGTNPGGVVQSGAVEVPDCNSDGTLKAASGSQTSSPASQFGSSAHGAAGSATPARTPVPYPGSSASAPGATTSRATPASAPKDGPAGPTISFKGVYSP